MHSDILNKLQELEKLLQGIQKLTKKLKNFYRKKDPQKQDKVLQKFIVFEGKAQGMLSELSEQKIPFFELEKLRLKAEEYDRQVEEFEECMNEEQYERYKEFRKNNFFEEKHAEITSSISSSSFTNTELRSSLKTLSINQSIKFDPFTRSRCKCFVM